MKLLSARKKYFKVDVMLLTIDSNFKLITNTFLFYKKKSMRYKYQSNKQTWFVRWNISSEWTIGLILYTDTNTQTFLPTTLPPYVFSDVVDNSETPFLSRNSTNCAQILRLRAKGYRLWANDYYLYVVC